MQYLFTNYVRGRFISAQSQEDWLTKLIVARPPERGQLGWRDPKKSQPNEGKLSWG